MAGGQWRKIANCSVQFRKLCPMSWTPRTDYGRDRASLRNLLAPGLPLRDRRRSPLSRDRGSLRRPADAW